MNPTQKAETVFRLAVDIRTLMKMLCSGQVTAERVAEEAGATVKIGRRRLYNVHKVQEYLDRISGGDKDGQDI